MTNPDLAALSEAATPGTWHTGCQNDALYVIAGRAPAMNNDYPWHDAPRVAMFRAYGPLEGDCLPVDASKNAAFIVALVNAYRSGDLVLIDREGMRERVKAALLKEEETNWNVTLGLDEDVSDLADAAIAAILGEG